MKFDAKVLDFLSQVDIGVIGSLSKEGLPQSAVVGVTSLAQGQELIVGTSLKSRKYANIKANPHVSLVLWRGTVTVQCEGETEILERSDARFDEYQRRIIAIHPEKQRYADDAEQIWIIIRPKWLRRTDISIKPWEIQEFIAK